MPKAKPPPPPPPGVPVKEEPKDEVKPEMKVEPKVEVKKAKTHEKLIEEIRKADLEIEMLRMKASLTAKFSTDHHKCRMQRSCPHRFNHLSWGGNGHAM